MILISSTLWFSSNKHCSVAPVHLPSLPPASRVGAPCPEVVPGATVPAFPEQPAKMVVEPCFAW
jgi:hypothetical protein